MAWSRPFVRTLLVVSVSLWGAACGGGGPLAGSGGDDDDDSGSSVQCQVDSCGPQGTCRVVSNATVCECAAGYAGTRCTDCAADFQDNEKDGTCLPACGSAAAVSCGAHGACADASGTAHCECQAGYTGDTCQACAAGMQDNDTDGTCTADCASAALRCGDHGQCADANGTAHCECANGYQEFQGSCQSQALAQKCGAAVALPLADGTVNGTTTGAGADFTPSCQAETGNEVVYRVQVVEPTHVVFTSGGFDTVMYLRSSCADSTTELGCDDDGGTSHGSQLDENLQPGTYFLFVDGWGTTAGPFSLQLQTFCPAGTVRDAASGLCVDNPCDPNPCTAAHRTECQVALPSFTCACDPSYTLQGETCVANPTPLGLTCADPIPLALADAVITGNMTGARSAQRGSCTGDGPERVYVLSVPERVRFTVSMTGYDTALYLRTACGTASSEVACNDDNEGQAAGLEEVLAPGTYFLFADSYQDGGAYQLHVSFRTDPCADDVCPGTPECVASSDWSSYSCQCPANTVPYEQTCVDNPCDPNPCTGEHRTRCTAQLPDAHTCDCSPGYVDNAGQCVTDTAAKEWTVLVYLNADNNLEDNGYGDVEEMEAVAASQDVRVVVLLDSYSRDNGRSRELLVQPGGSEVLADLGELDMSDWRTLRDFGIRNVQRFPARHYALIMWDHGAGWKAQLPRHPLKGFSNDENGTAEEISISNGDYAQALAGITGALGGKLDIVGFDACLMGMWEIAEASRPYGKLFVASEETMPGTGLPYTDWLTPLVNQPSMAPAEVCAVMVNMYYESDGSDSTYSCTDLESLDAMATAINGFADALVAHADLYGQVNTVRNASLSFTDDTFVDLGDFARRVQGMSGVPADLQQAAVALQTQLGITVLQHQEQSDFGNARGLAVYLPQRNSGMDPEYRAAGAVWSPRARWDEFLESFAH